MDDIFRPATEKELEERKIEENETTSKWVSKFETRKDVTKNPDGSYDVHGDLNFSESVGERLPVNFNKIESNFSCCGSLETLEGFPREVTGNLFLHNHGTRFTIKDIKRICNVKGRITVKFHQGL